MLPLVALFFTACSTDSSDIDADNSTAVLMNVEQPSQDADKSYFASCFDSATGFVEVDRSNGFTNPIVDFSVHVTGGFGSAKKMYTVTLQFQPLADCEDFYSDSGSVISYTMTTQVQNPQSNPPVMAINPSQLPQGCYKWRFVVESGVIGSTLVPYCQSVTPWYEAPLF